MPMIANSPFSQQKTMLRDNYQKYFWPLVQP
jgi:hypothetical protein